MKKAELEKELSKKIQELYSEENETRGFRDKLVDAQSKIARGEESLREVKVGRVYVEGQLSVLKRISGLYPEERMTHEEWMSAPREILSEHPRSF